VSLDLQATPPVITSAFAYDTLFGFDSPQYTVSGLGLVLAFDSRDSTINPYRGVYATVELDANPTFLGSSQASTLLSAEFRGYVGMSDAVPRNVPAFCSTSRS
jgi:outer membrane protein assembly factor BamA